MGTRARPGPASPRPIDGIPFAVGVRSGRTRSCGGSRDRSAHRRTPVAVRPPPHGHRHTATAARPPSHAHRARMHACAERGGSQCERLRVAL
eukprot:351602-Prymnesium_polylepis.1